MIVLESPAHEYHGLFGPDHLPEQGFLDDEALPHQGAGRPILAGAKQPHGEFRGFAGEDESLRALDQRQRLEGKHEQP
ncbi:MAG TPA: hypothetical protein VF832_05680 [Longimicrobiales bacterium]